MVARLVIGILAVVLLPLGIAFTLIGVIADDGDIAGFRTVGLAFLAAGVALALAFTVLRAREAGRRRRRRAGPRTRGRVVQARYLPGVRMGSAVAYELTVEFVPAGTASRMVLVVPGTELAAGAEIDLSYDPDEPQNFEPLIDGLV